MIRTCTLYMLTYTIAASKIKGTAREIYRIFPCNGDFPCIPTGVYTGNIPARPLKESRDSTPHSTVLTAGETAVRSGSPYQR